MLLFPLSFYMLCATAATVAALEITIPVDSPSRSEASDVAPDLVSLSIELDHWSDWVGSTSRNEFFYNTLDNLKQLAGVPPRIRVGGRSQDVAYLDYYLKDSEYALAVTEEPTPEVPYPEAVVMKLGTNYHHSVRFLPNNTHVVFGLNFATIDDLRGLFYLSSILEAFSSPEVKEAGVILDAIQIGNEPDVYATNLTHRYPGYNTKRYTFEWSNWAKNVLGAEEIHPGLPVKYWGASLAHSSHSDSGWSPQALFKRGIFDGEAGERVTTVSQHHFTGRTCAGGHPELQSLISKSSIRSSLDAFKPDIAATKKLGLDYVLGETGSYACHGADGVSNTAAAALWALDYALYASTLGISRAFFHQGIGYRSNFIQPVTLTRSPSDGSELPSPLAPHVSAQYYAAIVAAEAIGSSNKTRILEIPVKDSRVSAYAFYEGNKPVRALFINTQAYFAPEEGVLEMRPVVQVKVALKGLASEETFEIKRLSIPLADAKSGGLTWGGVSYETSDGRPSGEGSVECIVAGEEFDLYATEAVLAFFA